MQLFNLNVTVFGLIIYLVYALTTMYILIKKEYKLLSVLFPVMAIAEGLFIDWRWDKLQFFEGNIKRLLGGLPSFIISIGFPFFGFYLHHLISNKTRVYFRNRNLFPFVTGSINHTTLQTYYKRGFAYSFSVLMLHECSQVLKISSRNTFDYFDIIMILLGSLVSLVIYKLYLMAPGKQ